MGHDKRNQFSILFDTIIESLYVFATGRSLDNHGRVFFVEYNREQCACVRHYSIDIPKMFLWGVSPRQY